MHPLGNCPSSEELAAYIDGRLSKEDAARVAEHLASCENCFEVYSDVLQFQLEEESGEEEGGKVVRFPEAKKRGGVPWWGAIAALLVVGAGVGILSYRYLLAPTPELVPGRVVASLPKSASLSGEMWEGTTYRGSEDQENGDYFGNSFKAGVGYANLQVSLQAGDVTQAQNAIAGIIQALGNEGDLKKAYGEFTGDVGRSQAPTTLLSRADRLAQESRQFFEPLYVDLGQWAAAGHLAAKAQDPAFFRQPENRAFLRHVLWRDRLGFKESKLPAASRKDFYEIGKILDKSDLQPSDYEKLAGLFDKILEANYPD